MIKTLSGIISKLFNRTRTEILYHFDSIDFSKEGLQKADTLRESINLEVSTVAKKFFYSNIDDSKLIIKELYNSVLSDIIKSDVEMQSDYYKWVSKNKQKLTDNDFIINVLALVIDSEITLDTSFIPLMDKHQLTADEVKHIVNDFKIDDVITSDFKTLYDNLISAKNKVNLNIFELYSNLCLEKFHSELV